MEEKVGTLKALTSMKYNGALSRQGFGSRCLLSHILWEAVMQAVFPGLLESFLNGIIDISNTGLGDIFWLSKRPHGLERAYADIRNDGPASSYLRRNINRAEK